MSLSKVVEFFIGLIFFLFVMVLGVTSLILNRIRSSYVVLFYKAYIKAILNSSLMKLIFTQRTYKRDEYDNDAVLRGGAYIDELLHDMFGKRADYDPYKIEDSVIGFNKKVLFVNVSGEAKLHDGSIRGLSTLYRPNLCSLFEDGERLLVKADLGAGQLDFSYAGSVKFMNFGPTITVHGILPYIEVHIEFTVDRKSGQEGKLEKFIIDDMRGMNVWVTGLGPLNWAVNPIISRVTSMFKRFVRNFLEHKVEKHIAESIPNFKFPVNDRSVTNGPEVIYPGQSNKTNEENRETTKMLERTSEDLEPIEEEHESTLKEKLETSELEIETTKEDLEHTREKEPESTLKEKLETSNGPGLERISEEELENKNVPEQSSAELDQKQPKSKGSSNEQLEKEPELEHCSEEQGPKKLKLKLKIKNEAVLPNSDIESDESNIKESELQSSPELDQKQPKSKGSSNEQLEKEPELEHSSKEQLMEEQGPKKLKLKPMIKNEAVLPDSEIESGESSIKESDSDGSGTLSSSELPNDAAEALAHLDESYKAEDLAEDANESVLEE